MDCLAALECLNARLDGEASPDFEAPLAAHLESCADCRALAEELQAVDAMLQRELSHDPAAERVCRAALSKTPPVIAPRPELSGNRTSRFLAAFVAATTLAICLAVLLRGPNARGKGRMAASNEVVITLARGTVDVRPLAAKEWTPISLPNDAVQAVGTQFRTADASQCEFRCPSGGIVRVDERTELQLTRSSELSIAAGRIWCAAAAGSPLTVVASLTVEPRPPMVFSCPSDSWLQADVHPQDSAKVVAVRGPVRVERGAMHVQVEPNQLLSCSPEGVSGPVRADVGEETEWMLPLLALRGGHDNEFAGEVTSLLGRIGDTKASYIREERLIDLGAPGAIPLIAYLKETRGGADIRERHNAARVIRETAGAETALDLIQLLDDPVADVRIASAAALERISGLDQGVPSREWREFGDRQREAIARWNVWLRNRK